MPFSLLFLYLIIFLILKCQFVRFSFNHRPAALHQPFDMSPVPSVVPRSFSVIAVIVRVVGLNQCVRHCFHLMLALLRSGIFVGLLSFAHHALFSLAVVVAFIQKSSVNGPVGGGQFSFYIFHNSCVGKLLLSEMCMCMSR